MITGDHHVNHLLRGCLIRPVDELTARQAARLRTATGGTRAISAVDAVVAAFADTMPDPIVLTSAPGDLTALEAHVSRHVTVVAV